MSTSGKATFTLAEAAELLSCHRETLRRAIRVGELRAAKLGREFRISRPDLQAFWTACGGGDLFEKSVEQPIPEQAEKEPAQAAPKKGKAENMFQQLSLLGQTSSFGKAPQE